MSEPFGIVSCGAYVPQRRLSAQLLAESHGWFNPALSTRGMRSFANWDEDAITMAVEAGRAAIAGNSTVPNNVVLASTSLPFADRSNAGVVAEALRQPSSIGVSERSGSLRAGSGALIDALRQEQATLLIASDCSDTRPASAHEASRGHAAAAVLLGTDDPIATLLSSAQRNYDFVDHYRSHNQRFDYTLETRWTRDAGYRQQVGEVVDEALNAAQLTADAIDQWLIAAPPDLAKALARSLNVGDANGSLLDQVGYCASAQPLLLLNHVLERAARNQTLALINIGQGVDVTVFKVHRPAAEKLSIQLQTTSEELNYSRYLSLRGLLDLDAGLRAERDNRTAMSAFWRKHEAITGFVGGSCSACGTLQFPPSRRCVKCGSQGTQQPQPMADLPATVRSFTEDWLAYSPNPPLIFGNVGFPDGANVLMEFTDFSAGQVAVEQSVAVRFRIKDLDPRRQFRRYFWKAAPVISNG